MPLAVLFSRARSGIDAPEVTVEVHLAGGLPAFSIVGLPEKAVQESRDRVRGALQNARFDFPASRITVNLAPADLPKEGGRFDLAIALGILAASGQVAADGLGNTEFLGELSLNGDLRQVPGVLPAALAARSAGRRLILPPDNAEEAARIRDLAVLPARNLLSVTAHLNGDAAIAAVSVSQAPAAPVRYPDIADVRGQAHAKRALEVAAAGQHSLLFAGPPGSGKSMLASRLPGLLPELEEADALETAAIRSVAGLPFDAARWRLRPFRAPHHSASSAALVGGGSTPRPGEISLAHNGVLFLDELPEFSRHVLEALREPLETGRISISRAARQAEFPARFQLIAAMNPCPCGHLGDPRRSCRCTAEQVRRYRGRISGPLLDRIDLQLEVPPVPPEALSKPADDATGNTEVRARVEAARHLQRMRQRKPNALLDAAETVDLCPLAPADQGLLQQAMERLRLSARAYHRILRLARTIADLAGDAAIATPHLTEALGYRALDRDTQA
jgi:magnesium chelatase family protein